MTASRLERHPWRLLAWLLFVLSLTALNYAARLGGVETPDDVAYRYESSVVALFTYGLMLVILLVIAAVAPSMSFRETFALAPPASWRRAAGLVVLVLVSIWAVSAALAPFLDASEEQGLVPDTWDPDRAGAFVAFFLVVSVVAPVVEELTYRGLGFSLVLPYGSGPAILVTGFLFGASHGLLVGLPILAFFGLATGWLRVRTRSVYPSMALHGIFNGTALLVAVFVV